ncbi:hypothetical protein D3C76_1745230 [compost metagenome]
MLATLIPERIVRVGARRRANASNNATQTVISAAMAPRYKVCRISPAYRSSRSKRPRCQNHANSCSSGITNAQANTRPHQVVAASALSPRR